MSKTYEIDQFGNRVLPDGSFIHPSRSLVDGNVVSNNRWFLWVCTKPGLPGQGAEGFILMDDHGIVYFKCVAAAMERHRLIRSSPNAR